jgi:fructosamine-3-kinase
VSVLPEGVRLGLEEALGARVIDARMQSGGQVATAARVETDQGPVFAKWRCGTPARFFAMEADGLDRLRAASGLRVPRVLARKDLEEGGRPPFLALEWLEPRRTLDLERFAERQPYEQPADPQGFAERLGEGLAEMHRTALAPDGRFGLHHDNYLGSQPQRNTWAESWAVFYRDHRLVPQIERGVRDKRILPSREALLRETLERVEEVLVGCPSPAALVHGDLWAGNLLQTVEGPALVDPAVYYADREVEIAYMQLFSGFSARTFVAYDGAYPLPEGWRYRQPMHQLYPLLIHLNHFGGSYGAQVEEVCRFYT